MSTFSPNLAIQLIATGDQSGQWGLTTNVNLGTLIESAISGYVTQTFSDTNITLPMPPGADGGNGSVANPVAARNMFITCQGTNTAQRNLFVPNNTKLYFISNQTTGGFGINVTTVGGTGIVVPNGQIALLVCNGVNVVNAITYLPGLTAPINIAAPASGVALTVNGSSSSSVINAVNNGIGASFGSILNAAGTALAITSPAATSSNIFTLIQSGQSTWALNNNATTNLLQLFSGARPVMNWGQSGNLVIPTPVSGVALTALGVANTFPISIFGPAGGYTGLTINQTGQTPISFYQPASSSDARIQTNNTDRVVVTVNGNVVIDTPSNGVALAVNGLSGQLTERISAPNTASNSFGLQITAGTNSSDFGFAVANAIDTLNYFIVYGDGGAVVGNPTGSDQGIGSINSQTSFINGDQVYSGVPPSSSTTISRADVNKCVVATVNITVPNGVFNEGDCVSIYNDSASSITIVAGIVTMRLAGTGTTGSRILSQRGMATIWFRSSTECVVSGSGVS